MTPAFWVLRLTLANRITLVRFLLIPIFALLVMYYLASVSEGRANEVLRWGAGMVFLLSCLTDALDGFFARARGEQTRFGTIVDPLADKFLLLTALVLLSGPWSRAFRPHFPPWYVLLLLSRDVLLIAGAVVVHITTGHIEVRPRVLGKLATVLQMVMVIWVFVGGMPLWFNRLLVFAAICTLASAAQYIADGVGQIEKTHAHEKPAPAP